MEKFLDCSKKSLTLKTGTTEIQFLDRYEKAQNLDKFACAIGQIISCGKGQGNGTILETDSKSRGVMVEETLLRDRKRKTSAFKSGRRPIKYW